MLQAAARGRSGTPRGWTTGRAWSRAWTACLGCAPCATAAGPGSSLLARACEAAARAARPRARQGFPQVSPVDIRDSAVFLEKVADAERLRARALVAADCGAGIGRISQNLLLPRCAEVDVVEPMARAHSASSLPVTRSPHDSLAPRQRASALASPRTGALFGAGAGGAVRGGAAAHQRAVRAAAARAVAPRARPIRLHLGTPARPLTRSCVRARCDPHGGAATAAARRSSGRSAT